MNERTPLTPSKHSPKPPASSAEEQPAGRPWRYGLGFLFLLTVVASVAAAGASYAVRGIMQGTLFHFLLFILAAPLLLVVGLSTAMALGKWLKRRMK